NDRAGGRVWSVRRGTRFEELGGAVQYVNFEDGEYFNPGPWRIPYSHKALLDYCRRLGVDLQVFINHNRNTLIHRTGNNNGEPVSRMPTTADFVGYTSELLSKATNQGALDEELTSEDRERLLEALRTWGALNEDYEYTGGSRRGYDEYMGAGHRPGVPSEAQPLEQLLSGEAWRALGAEWGYEALTMFQPVGGMDQIAAGFERQIGHLIRYRSKVTEIRQDDGEVRVRYENLDSGEIEEATGDYCICTIPLSVLSQIRTDFSPEFQEAITSIPYGAATKVGLQFKRRFWEEDDRIYGGITSTDLPISQIAYPNYNFFNQKGVVLGAYTFGGDISHKVTGMSPEERIQWALDNGRQVHPQYDEEFDSGFAVGWHRVPWTLGCSASWIGTTREDYYDTLLQPDGRVYLAGEHLSYLGAWMEGAILSALDVIEAVHDRAMSSEETARA
ncbi:MAG TPA: flavin monoamine oxidase family protein, partial [Deinococcales bacterium]|nr:flavin monoamine oxidase family protein [Deinococcales bacterium]